MLLDHLARVGIPAGGLTEDCGLWGSLKGTLMNFYCGTWLNQSVNGPLVRRNICALSPTAFW